MTPETARRHAKALRAKVQLGADPAAEQNEQRASASVEELGTRYLSEEIRPVRKPATAALYARYFNDYIFPALAKRRARDLTHADVVRLHRAIGQRGPVTANRVVALMSAFYSWGMKVGALPKGENPAHGVTRYRERARERYLSAEEWQRLGDALREGETVGIEWEIDDTEADREAYSKALPARVALALRSCRGYPASC